MNASHYRRLVDYNYWAHRRVWDCVTPLTDEQFRRPSDYSIGSLHQLGGRTLEQDFIFYATYTNNS